MAVSKATVLNALATFKGLQDAANDEKFVAKDGDKVLSTNDYTTAEKSKLEGVAAGAQVNVIESITIDGNAQPVTNKGVALDLSAYVKGTDVASALRYKSSVNATGNLPSSGQQIGDVYNIKTAGGTDADGVAIKAGDNVVWNGTGWDVLAGTVDLSGYALKSEVQAVSGGAITTVKVDNVALTTTENTVNIDLSGKVDKVTGKQLSTEDFTTELKTKLDAITDENITTAEVQAIFNS